MELAGWPDMVLTGGLTSMEKPLDVQQVLPKCLISQVGTGKMTVGVCLGGCVSGWVFLSLAQTPVISGL